MSYGWFLILTALIGGVVSVINNKMSKCPFGHLESAFVGAFIGCVLAFLLITVNHFIFMLPFLMHHSGSPSF